MSANQKTGGLIYGFSSLHANESLGKLLPMTALHFQNVIRTNRSNSDIETGVVMLRMSHNLSCVLVSRNVLII